MEFLVSRNYTNFSVGDAPSNEYLSVMVSVSDFANMRYGGIFMADDAARFESGYLTYFRINPAYRVRFEDSFTYCNNEATLVAYVEGNVVYIVMEDVNKPLLYPRDYRYFRQQENLASKQRA